jgi:hypothetical protein
MPVLCPASFPSLTLHRTKHVDASVANAAGGFADVYRQEEEDDNGRNAYFNDVFRVGTARRCPVVVNLELC